MGFVYSRDFLAVVMVSHYIFLVLNANVSSLSKYSKRVFPTEPKLISSRKKDDFVVHNFYQNIGQTTSTYLVPCQLFPSNYENGKKIL